MVRGHAKFQAQQKRQQKLNKQKPKRDQKKDAAVALTTACPICKV